MSPRKFSSERRDALTYRQLFIERWVRFLHAEFASPEEAAAVFAVDGTTAKKWWAGSHAPSGFVVGYAFAQYPATANATLRGA
jgi:hypothetical protein